MSRWLAYTVGLKEDADADDILTALDDTADTELLAAVKSVVQPDHLPSKYPEWGVLSKRVSTSGEGYNKDQELTDRITEWLCSVIDCIDVVYFTSISDTSDYGTIRVFQLAGDQLEAVEKRDGEVRCDRDKADLGEDKYFPEYAMVISPVEDSRLGPDRETDHLRELENKYGARPLIHY